MILWCNIVPDKHPDWKPLIWSFWVLRSHTLWCDYGQVEPWSWWRLKWRSTDIDHLTALYKSIKDVNNSELEEILMLTCVASLTFFKFKLFFYFCGRWLKDKKLLSIMYRPCTCFTFIVSIMLIVIIYHIIHVTLVVVGCVAFCLLFIPAKLVWYPTDY